MDPNLLARVRWRNLSVALGLAALLVLVVAWPRLQPAEPALPPDVPRAVETAGGGGRTAPVAEDEGLSAGMGGERPRTEGRRAERPRAARPSGRRAERPRAVRRRKNAEQRASGPANPVVPVWRPPPPPPRPEFGFED